MNSDPYDSAAWRAFGMLDADESAIFDEALRHDPLLRSASIEMDRLCAAIGAASAAPVPPRAGQLERLQVRLGLYPIRRSYLWLGVSGWAAAAVLAFLLVISHLAKPTAAGSRAAAVEHASSAATVAGRRVSAPRIDPPATAAVPSAAADESPAAAGPAAVNEMTKVRQNVETKRLVQEIEVLRGNLEKFQQRDRVLFDALPGVAVPVIMTMRPPDADSPDVITLAQNDLQGSITGMLGDALKLTHPAGRIQHSGAPEKSGDPVDESGLAATVQGAAVAADPDASALPTAIPIYDAARDSGTLVVNNLPAAGEGQVYNLWVNTREGEAPVYVGSLPETSGNGVDSFDFNLGSTKVLPSGFVLTKDDASKPAPPSAANTVLQGPPNAGR